MSKPIVDIENVSKRYQIGAHKEPYLSLRNEIAQLASRLITGGRGQPSQDFWALKDVSFSVQEGEAVGIIGRNGAGKSTLLKILSQITPPTEGKIIMRGRVASLLEVGTGFHPELTGRENIFLNGTILGMTRREVRRKFDEIVSFAEVEKFLDTPVKRYSSGMYVRLAFAVAAHLEPEILVVDEVLAVGDAEFQKKCLGKMGEIADIGRTVLFVSHNMGAILELCKTAIQLDKGQVVFAGTSIEVVENYISKICNRKRSIKFEPNTEKNVQITGMKLTKPDGSILDSLLHTQPFCVNIEYIVRQWPSNTYVTLDIFDQLGTQLLWSPDVTSVNDMSAKRAPGRYIAQIAVPSMILKPGIYNFSSGIFTPGIGVVDVKENAVSIEIVDGGSILSALGIHKHPSMIAIPLKWETELVDEKFTF